MKSRTLKELRDLAKARGLKGYSKLPKDELVRQLEGREPNAASEKPAAPTSAKSGPKSDKTGRRRTKVAESATSTASHAGNAVAPAVPTDTVGPTAATPDAAPVSSVAAVATAHAHFANAEQEVEDAKYTLRPDRRPAIAPGTDLDEDIDRLPVLADPLVCLLAQKPGVLYAYWVLSPGETAGRSDYKLRLCQMAGDSLQIYEEVPVQGDRGSWYFHVSEQAGSAALAVQLGYYENGRFITARGRSIARLPSLHASARTDQRWWVAEADFTRMYVRAGGRVTPTHEFSWTASLGGSPSGAQTSSDQTMALPGGSSSPMR